jgi:hypothetical protein
MTPTSLIVTIFSELVDKKNAVCLRKMTEKICLSHDFYLVRFSKVLVDEEELMLGLDRK